MNEILRVITDHLNDELGPAGYTAHANDDKSHCYINITSNKGLHRTIYLEGSTLSWPLGMDNYRLDLNDPNSIDNIIPNLRLLKHHTKQVQNARQ